MNPLALFLLVTGVALGVGGLILATLSGAPYNVLWLLGIGAVLASMYIQIFNSVEDIPEEHPDELHHNITYAEEKQS